MRVITKIIERKWMNQRAEFRARQFRFHKWQQLFAKVNFELGRDVRSCHREGEATTKMSERSRRSLG